MYEDIINEIKSNLGENKYLNRKYLSSQIERYKDISHKSKKDCVRFFLTQGSTVIGSPAAFGMQTFMRVRVSSTLQTMGLVV